MSPPRIALFDSSVDPSRTGSVIGPLSSRAAVVTLVTLAALGAMGSLLACTDFEGHADLHSVHGGGGRVSVRGAPVEVREAETIPGDLVVVGGRARVDGEIQGNLVVVGGHLVVGPKARVEGDLVSVGNHQSQIARSARLGGDRIEVNHGLVSLLVGNLLWAMDNPATVALTAGVGLLLFLGLAYLLLVRRYESERFHATVEHRPVRAALLGLLVLVALHILMVATFLAAWGIGLSIALGLLAAILHLAGWLVAAGHLGRAVARRAGWPMNAALSLLLGVAVALLAFLVPVLGQIAWAVGTWIGLGALLDPLARADLPPPAGSTAPPPLASTGAESSPAGPGA